MGDLLTVVYGFVNSGFPYFSVGVTCALRTQAWYSGNCLQHLFWNSLMVAKKGPCPPSSMIMCGCSGCGVHVEQMTLRACVEAGV